jgi:hypothetical protein
VGLAAAAVGLVVLAWRLRTRALYLVGLVATLVLSFFAHRFLVFVAPLAAICIACCVIYTARRMPRRPAGKRYWVAVPTALALAVVGLPVNTILDTQYFGPSLNAIHAQVMERTRQDTPRDAIVWTDWSLGYPTQYFAQRRTLGDGSYHPGHLLYAQYAGMMLEDWRTAANWIQFYCAHGRDGLEQAKAVLDEDWQRAMEKLKRVLGAGPEGARSLLAGSGLERGDVEELVQFFFPETPPIYVLFIFDHSNLNRIAFAVGNWDFARRQAHPLIYLPVVSIEQVGKNVFRGVAENQEVVVDVGKGLATSMGKTIPLNNFYYVNKQDQPSKLHYKKHQSDVSFEITPKGDRGVVMQDQAAHAVLHKLFVRSAADLRYFEPVFNNPMAYQLWKVTPETAERSD